MLTIDDLKQFEKTLYDSDYFQNKAVRTRNFGKTLRTINSRTTSVLRSTYLSFIIKLVTCWKFRTVRIVSSTGKAKRPSLDDRDQRESAQRNDRIGLFVNYRGEMTIAGRGLETVRGSGPRFVPPRREINSSLAASGVRTWRQRRRLRTISPGEGYKLRSYIKEIHTYRIPKSIINRYARVQHENTNCQDR